MKFCVLQILLVSVAFLCALLRQLCIIHINDLMLPISQQAGALVMIYKDGSVLVTHGGTEMGQGLHTKMIQVVHKKIDE